MARIEAQDAIIASLQSTIQSLVSRT
jgi:hypothetical protein